MGYCSDCHKFMSVILIFSDSESACEMKLEKKNNRQGWGGDGGGWQNAHSPTCTLSSF